MPKKHFFKLITLTLAAAFVLSGCSFKLPWQKPVVEPPVDNTGPAVHTTVEESLAAQSQIKKFASLEDLAAFLEEGNTANNSYSGYAGIATEKNMRMVDVPTAMPVADVGLDTGMAAGFGVEESLVAQSPGSDDFSQTNVQVEGVDEADIIKTDGKYIYAVAKNSLFIINAYPADNAEILSKIEFKDRPQDLYISGDRLVVYGENQQDIEPYREFRRHSPYTFFKVFDISDRKNPKQVRDIDFEGTYNNSRMIGDYVYFVTSLYNYYYIADEPIIPRIIEGGEVLANTCAANVKCFIPDIYYFDIPYSSYNFTTVSAINIKDNNSQITGDTYLMSYSQNMYVSQDNIYITYTKYISEYQLAMEVLKEIVFPRLNASDQEKINAIQAVENYILSPEEKMQKIAYILERFQASLTDQEQDSLEKEVEDALSRKYEELSAELEKTVIHKIGIDKDKLEYRATGEVTGNVLNQFSMDENNGYFRIATTKNSTWSRFQDEEIESYNNLYVLDGDLKVVGKVEKLAEGERIYSVRFMQNRAYMVTFKQVDPLFAIDLSNPRDPKVLGKLKIPGFSNYLHPYDNNLLIGIGKDTSETEFGGVRTKGLKFSLFDVSNINDPKEVDTYVMGDSGSDSIALNDHKAFLFSKEKNLLVIPVSIREDLGNRGYGNLTFVGAAVLKVNENGFEFQGKIDHSDGGKPAQADYWRGYNYYDNTVRRSLYIDNNLYTFSNQYIKINNLDGLNQIKEIKLEKTKAGSDIDYEIIN